MEHRKFPIPPSAYQVAYCQPTTAHCSRVSAFCSALSEADHPRPDRHFSPQLHRTDFSKGLWRRISRLHFIIGGEKTHPARRNILMAFSLKIFFLFSVES